MVSPGTQSGVLVTGVIRKFNPDGTVLVRLSEQGKTIEANVPAPLAWAGPREEFIGGYPGEGSNVTLSRGQGGRWYIENYIPSNNTFGRNYITPDVNKLSVLQPGRILLQTRNNKRLFIDPSSGIHIGSSRNFAQFNPTQNLYSHNYQQTFTSTDASLSLDKLVRRDKSSNLSRNVVGSTLDSQAYEKQITLIGMDPVASVWPATSAGSEDNQIVRNPALAEKRELVYEFGLSFNFTNDRDEGNRYVDPTDREAKAQISRRQMRTDAFSLSLEYPNHLMETVKGTGVDLFGNILDLNRNILPLGRNEVNSFRKNKNKKDAFARIRAQHRKSLAFHFEINARKGDADLEVQEPPSPKDTSDYGRQRSRFFIDIDKEGQFKINVPASSEVGNVPLHTRYENFSVLEAARNNGETDPNEFLKNVDKRDIFIESYSSGAGINLISEDPDSFQLPLNYQGQEEPINFGTAFHDITTASCPTFLTSYTEPLVRFQPDNRINSQAKTYEQIVQNNIIVSGDNANAGGRSGQLNLDGWVSVSIGANTVDRQSLWLDCAGGVVTHLGKDKNNLSYALTTDGDMIIQIGGNDLGDQLDSRFEGLSNGFVPRNLQIHVPTSNGPMIFKMGTDPGGFAAIDLVSPGQLNIVAQQDITMESVSGRVMIEGQTVEMHPKTAKRQVLKIPGRSI